MLLPVGFKYLYQRIHPGGKHLMQINLVLTKCVGFSTSTSQFSRMGSHLTFSCRSGNSQAQSATKDVLPVVGDAVETRCSTHNESKDGMNTTPHQKATDSKLSQTVCQLSET